MLFLEAQLCHWTVESSQTSSFWSLETRSPMSLLFRGPNCAWRGATPRWLPTVLLVYVGRGGWKHAGQAPPWRRTHPPTCPESLALEGQGGWESQSRRSGEKASREGKDVMRGKWGRGHRPSGGQEWFQKSVSDFALWWHHIPAQMGSHVTPQRCQNKVWRQASLCLPASISPHHPAPWRANQEAQLIFPFTPVCPPQPQLPLGSCSGLQHPQELARLVPWEETGSCCLTHMAQCVGPLSPCISHPFKYWYSQLWTTNHGWGSLQWLWQPDVSFPSTLLALGVGGSVSSWPVPLPCPPSLRVTITDLASMFSHSPHGWLFSRTNNSWAIWSQNNNPSLCRCIWCS